MTQNKRQASITILGSSGGAAKAILSILNQAVIDKNDPLHVELVTSTIHLIDIQQKTLHYFENLYPNLSNQIYLYEQDLKNLTLFREHLQKTSTTIVIDVSWADTIDMLTCCNELGVFYLNSA